jgi:hypothetical protein
MIKGFNYMNCSMAATTYKGASIVSYRITNGSNVINASSGGFENSESNVFVFEVEDNRGLKNSYTTTLEMIDYFKPIVNLDVKAPNAEGELTFTIKGSFYNGSFGVKDNELKVFYRYSTDEESIDYTEATDVSISGNDYTATVYLPKLNYLLAHTFRAKVMDSAMTIETAEKTVKTQTIFDWGENDFNFNVPVSIQGKELDYVTSQGNVAGWNYRIWKSGIAELWTITEPVDINANQLWGNLYYCDNAFPSYAFPFEFEEVPSIVATPMGGNGNFWIFTNSGSGNSTTETQAFGALRPTSYTLLDARLSIQVKGVFKRWI